MPAAKPTPANDKRAAKNTGAKKMSRAKPIIPRGAPPVVIAPPPRPTDEFIAENIYAHGDGPALEAHDPVEVLGESCDPVIQVRDAYQEAYRILQEGHPATAQRHLEVLRYWAGQGIAEAVINLNTLNEKFHNVAPGNYPEPSPHTVAVEPAAAPAAGELTPKLAKTGPKEPHAHIEAPQPVLTDS